MEHYNLYTKVLKEQLIPATGCTEPIALAYGAAMGRGILGELPEKIVACISGSIIKNVKSVIVPGTGGKKGIEVAIAAGIVVGKENVGLEVLADAPENTDARIEQYLKECPIIVKLADSDFIFDIWLKMESKNHKAEVRIAGHHTNVILKKKDDVVLLERAFSSEITDVNTEEALHIEDILEYAQTCKLEDVESVIMRQIDCNTAISKEGLSGKWGAQIGKILLSSSENPNVELRAKAAAAAGSDARMSGCEMPVVINSGSGNQGMTITLPLVEYAKELNADHETLIRSLVLANLVAIRIKQSIGFLCM